MAMKPENSAAPDGPKFAYPGGDIGMKAAMPTNEIALIDGWDSVAENPALVHRMSREDMAEDIGGLGRLAYLASPLSKRGRAEDGAADYAAMLSAAHDAEVWAAWCATVGITAISPVSQSMQAYRATASGVGAYSGTTGVVPLRLPVLIDPLDGTFWARWCAPLLAACEVMIVPPIHGWRESAGIAFEAQRMIDDGRDVYLVEGTL